MEEKDWEAGIVEDRDEHVFGRDEPDDDHAHARSSENEARVTRAALDLFSRVMTGQVEIVEEVLRDYYPATTKGEPLFTLDQLNDFWHSVRRAKEPIGLPMNGSYGIFHADVHPAARLAWSMVRRAEGQADETGDKLAVEADKGWRAKHGEPRYGRPVEIPRQRGEKR